MAMLMRSGWRTWTLSWMTTNCWRWQTAKEYDCKSTVHSCLRYVYTAFVRIFQNSEDNHSFKCKCQQNITLNIIYSCNLKSCVGVIQNYIFFIILFTLMLHIRILSVSNLIEFSCSHFSPIINYPCSTKTWDDSRANFRFSSLINSNPRVTRTRKISC